MKKLIFTLTLLFSVVALMAQQVQRDKVILEIATGCWCTYCPGAAMGADDLIANGHDVAVIEYHNGDPFANLASNYRNGSYYNVSGYPTAKFDGVLTVVGGSHTQSMYPQYVNRYNQRIVIPCNFTVGIFGENNGLDYDITLMLDQVEQYSGTNLVAHLVLTESEIAYSWQGMSEVNFVERLMIPDHFGTALDFSGGDEIILNLNFTLGASWVTEHCELVAFIQNNSTKEILQGTKVALNDLNPYVLPLQADFTASDTLICVGTEVLFTDQSAGNPSSWSWSFQGATPDTSNEQNPIVTYHVPGTYDVSLMVSTGFVTNTLRKENYITVIGEEVTFDSIQDQCIHYEPFELTQGGPEGGEYFGPGITDGWFDPEAAGLGTHTLGYTYTDPNTDCTDTAYQTVYVDECTGIIETTGIEIALYPNPNQGKFVLTLNSKFSKFADIKIINAIGKIVYEENNIIINGIYSSNINLEEFSNGIYYLSVKSDNYVDYKKIILQH